MRFIINFFLFGIIFYLIYIFFPEAFNTLVSWANQVYTFLHDLILGIVNSVKEKQQATPPAHPEATPPAAALLWFVPRYFS